MEWDEILREEFLIPMNLNAHALQWHCAWHATLVPALNSGLACGRILI